MTNKPINIILFIILALCVMYIQSCTYVASVPAELQQAEELMEDAPDSALTILDNFEKPEELSKKDYALFCLLLTQALDKNYYIHTSDSIIQVATTYYEEHNDMASLALSYYYMGRVYSDMHKSLQAQQYYLKALELGEDLNMPDLLIKINNSLGTLYFFQDIYEQALPLYKKTISLLNQKKDSTNLSYALRNTARALKEIGQPDSAAKYYKEAIKITTPQSMPFLLNDLGGIYLQEKKYDEAYDCITNAIQLCNKTQLLAPIQLSLGEYFYQTAQYDSAQVYLNKSAQTSILYTRAGSLCLLAQIEKTKLDFKSYLKYWDEYEQIRDSIEKDSHFENIRITESMFNYQRITDEKNKYEQKAFQRMIIIYQILIFSTIMLFIGFLVFKREQLKKKKILELKETLYKQSLQCIEDNKIKISVLEKELTSEKETISDVNKQLFEAKKLILEMENRQIKLKHNTIQLIEQEFKKSYIYTRIHKTENKLSESEWTELALLLDATYSNFTKRLYECYPQMSPEELHMCYLVKTGIPVKKIAILMNISSSGVSHCRRRLYKKLTNQSESAEKFDSFIADF